ncbi:hypothetical protein [Parasphingopyxis lamellibrachiae]|uniref:Uncharacterized protein n=1 Tax=Parasphingopyxis lamellibrachiae TaxID=680125 RepID=A0A3D9FD19_9SPHN|nr:hypothetical protein [Parasphingopyxis lamellibrachiae]RED15715.1 hypothetical protein DFR46_0718 [Parasphingopyxis lamellibrachiae]
MKKLVGMTAALILFSGCVETDEPAADSGATDDAQEADAATVGDVLSAGGWGPLRIGMSRDEVVAAVGGPADPEAMGSPEPEFCDQFPPAQAPTGMFVMIESGVLTSISLSAGSTLQTSEGLSVGDSADAVRAAYGDRLDVLPHNYIGLPAEYLTVWSTGEITENGTSDENARGIRYETNAEGVIELIHAGGPSIQYVEGCL